MSAHSNVAVEDRDPESIATACCCMQIGVDYLRVHNRPVA
jgi:dihydropteroate synthase